MAISPRVDDLRRTGGWADHLFRGYFESRTQSTELRPGIRFAYAGILCPMARPSPM